MTGVVVMRESCRLSGRVMGVCAVDRKVFLLGESCRLSGRVMGVCAVDWRVAVMGICAVNR